MGTHQLHKQIHRLTDILALHMNEFVLNKVHIAIQINVHA
jgi:hypothetical protein